jgi:hypothetical protein
VLSLALDVCPRVALWGRWVELALQQRHAMIGSRCVLAFVISPFSFSNVFQTIALCTAWRLASYWPWLGYLVRTRETNGFVLCCMRLRSRTHLLCGFARHHGAASPLCFVPPPPEFPHYVRRVAH